MSGSAAQKKTQSKVIQAKTTEVTVPRHQSPGSSIEKELLDLVRKQAATMEGMSARLIHLEEKLESVGAKKTPQGDVEERITAKMVIRTFTESLELN